MSSRIALIAAPDYGKLSGPHQRANPNTYSIPEECPPNDQAPGAQLHGEALLVAGPVDGDLIVERVRDSCQRHRQSSGCQAIPVAELIMVLGHT